MFTVDYTVSTVSGICTNVRSQAFCIITTVLDVRPHGSAASHSADVYAYDPCGH